MNERSFSLVHGNHTSDYGREENVRKSLWTQHWPFDTANLVCLRNYSLRTKRVLLFAILEKLYKVTYKMKHKYLAHNAETEGLTAAKVSNS